MPSRRQLLAGGVVAAGGVVGGYAGKWPISLDGEAKWPMARHDPAGTGATDQAGPKSEPELLWQAKADKQFDGRRSPVLIGDTLVASNNRSLVALDRETGEQRYERGGSYYTSPVVARADAYRSDVLVTGTDRGFVGVAASGGFALGGVTVGYERWQAAVPGGWQFGAALQAGTVAADGTVYGTVPGTNRVVAIDANSGRIEWRYRVGNEEYRELNRPAVRDGTIYVTSSVDRVVALDADTGTRKWQTTIEPLEREDSLGYTMPNAPTVTEEGLVVPTSKFVDLRSFDDGSRRWRYVHDGTTATASAAVANGTIVLSDGEQSLYGIALGGGDKLWQSDFGQDTAPIVADGIVYLSDYWLPELRAFDATTGEPLWAIEIPHAGSQPIVNDGLLYVSTSDGLLALRGQR